MICWQTLYERPKRLRYDFLPDFIVRLTGFDHKPSNVNYFSFSGFSASRLSSKFFLSLCSVGFETTFNLRNMGNKNNLDYEPEGV